MTDSRETKGSRARFRVGVDVGGTFTDIVVAPEAGALAVRKILSTPEDYAAGHW